MRQPIQQRRRHPLALKNLHPVAESQVAGYQQAGSLITVREDLEQQFSPPAGERQVTQLITDQQVSLVELRQQALQLVLLLRLLQTGNQIGSGEETHPASLTASCQRQRYCQMRLASSRTADQTAIVTLVDPVAAGKLQQLVLVDVWHQAEIVAVEVLHHRETSLLDASPHGVGGAGCDLQLSQPQQELFVPLVAIGSIIRQFGKLCRDSWQPQLFQVGFQQHGGVVVHHSVLLLIVID
jgi:hypothetical protein